MFEAYYLQGVSTVRAADVEGVFIALVGERLF
jgi:hypothetical protein